MTKKGMAMNSKRGRGRPPAGENAPYGSVLHISVEPGVKAELEEVARDVEQLTGIPVSLNAVVRKMLSDGLEARRNRPPRK